MHHKDCCKKIRNAPKDKRSQIALPDWPVATSDTCGGWQSVQHPDNLIQVAGSRHLFGLVDLHLHLLLHKGVPNGWRFGRRFHSFNRWTVAAQWSLATSSSLARTLAERARSHARTSQVLLPSSLSPPNRWLQIAPGGLRRPWGLLLAGQIWSEEATWNSSIWEQVALSPWDTLGKARRTGILRLIVYM